MIAIVKYINLDEFVVKGSGCWSLGPMLLFFHPVLYKRNLIVLACWLVKICPVYQSFYVEAVKHGDGLMVGASK